MSDAKVVSSLADSPANSQPLTQPLSRLSVVALCAAFLCACSPAENSADSNKSAANKTANSEQTNNAPYSSKHEYVPPAGKERQVKRPVQEEVALPDDDSDPVVLAGVIHQWSYEGDIGCFGSIIADDQQIQLWADIELCDEVDYAENERATLEIVYRPEDQQTDDTLYTVVGFL